MVMLASIGAAALGVYMLQANKNLSMNSQRMTNDREAEEIVANINATLATPAGCNANLPAGTAVTGSLASFKRANGTTLYAINDFGIVQNKRLRIKSINYTRTTVQSTKGTGSRPRARPGGGNEVDAKPSIITFTILFDRVIRKEANGTPILSKAGPYLVEAYVVSATLGGAPGYVLTDSSTVIGCARSPSSTYY